MRFAALTTSYCGRSAPLDASKERRSVFHPRQAQVGLVDPDSLQIIIDEVGSDREKLKEVKVAYGEVVESVSSFAVQQYSKELIEDIGSRLTESVQERRSQRDEFHGEVLRIWREPLDQLTALVGSCLDVIVDQIRRRQRRKKNVNKNFAIAQVQSRIIQVCHEAMLLLEFGYADGAYARWRTLHELSVILKLLVMHDESLAERYIDYCAVEQLKILDSHNDFAKKNGTRKIPSREYKRAASASRAALLKHGSDFAKLNAWAVVALKRRKVDIKIMEEAAGLDYIRPIYTTASSAVHGNSHGWAYKVGVPVELSKSSLLLGPSLYGMHVPGVEIARSLFEIISASIEGEKGIDNAVLVTVIAGIASEAIRSFKLTGARFVVEHRENTQRKRNS